MPPNKKPITIIILSSILLIIIIYLGFNYWVNKKELSSIRKEISNNQQDLSKKITDIETILLTTQEKSVTLAEALDQTKEKTESLNSQFNKVNKNVSKLEKITQTDPELLQKYSKIYFLNENYVPLDLKDIPNQYTFNQQKKYKIHAQVWPSLQDLLDDAKDAGMSLEIISAFRSFGEQAQLKGAYTVNYGAGTANQFSADQGYSEHQLGTTVDFTNPTVADTFSGFSKSKEYQWLTENAYKYGFILSYPKNNGYYQFEPWHWRFVGKKLAKYLHDKNKNFYDLSQREIDKYIADLFN